MISRLQEKINNDIELAKTAKSKNDMNEYYFLKGRAHGTNECIELLGLLDNKKTGAVSDKILKDECIVNADITSGIEALMSDSFSADDLKDFKLALKKFLTDDPQLSFEFIDSNSALNNLFYSLSPTLLKAFLYREPIILPHISEVDHEMIFDSLISEIWDYYHSLNS